MNKFKVAYVGEAKCNSWLQILNNLKSHVEYRRHINIADRVTTDLALHLAHIISRGPNDKSS